MIFFFKVRYIPFYTILIDHLYDSFWGIWLNESSIFIKTAWQLMCNFFSLFYCTLYKLSPILSYPISDSPILSSSILSFSYTILSYPIFRSTSNPISYLIFYPILSSVPSYPILSFFLSVPILFHPFFLPVYSIPSYPTLSFLHPLPSHTILSFLSSFLFYPILSYPYLLPFYFTPS